MGVVTKFIPQSIEFVGDSRVSDPLKIFEIAARTCYNSLDKIAPGSDIDLALKLIQRGHYSPFEFAVVHGFENMSNANKEDYINLPHAKKKFSTGRLISTEGSRVRIWDAYDVGVSFRVLLENGKAPLSLKMRYPEVFMSTPGCSSLIEYDDNYDTGNPFITYRLITSRSVMAEITRHRSMSFCVQSTRYVDYMKQGFNFIVSETLKDDPIAVNHLEIACKRSAASYATLTSMKKAPQACREVLPGAFSTTIIMGGYVSDWLGVFQRRIDPAAHPDVKMLMELVQKDMFAKSILTDYVNSLDNFK